MILKNMLAKNGINQFDELINSKDYLMDIKENGYRVFAIKNNLGVSIYGKGDSSVTGLRTNYTSKIPYIVKQLDNLLPLNTYIDCELCYYDKSGKQDRQKVTKVCNTNDGYNQIIHRNKYPLFLELFDIPIFNNVNISKFPLIKRKQILNNDINVTDFNNINIVEYSVDDKENLFEKARRNMLEGVMFKDINSPYEFGKRSKFWLKYKFWDTEDCFIVGYKEGTGKYTGQVGSLEIAQYDKKLDIIKRGFVNCRTDIERLEWTNLVSVDNYINKVVEIGYTSILESGKFENPVFYGLRTDKDFNQCVISR